ncbi:MAG: PD40 domain-containing protein [Chloroflexi bacterium]|nr:PD40 domain-containing protein [Chloroflexota bacterium]
MGAKIALEACPHEYGFFDGFDSTPCDIYVVDPETGTVSHLTTGSNPVWSPDGQRMLFTHRTDARRDQGVYIVNADGSNVSKVATGLSPAWTPDGANISYTSGPCGEQCIYLAQPDGSGASTIASGVFSSYPYSWSPRGSHVTYIAINSTPASVGLYVVAVTPGSAASKPLSAPDTAPGVASWFPDGKRVVFLGRVHKSHDIYAAGIEDAHQTRLTTIGDIEGPVKVSPDGLRIAFLRSEAEEWGLHTVSAKGSDLNFLTKGMTGHVWTYAWSPDGKRLVVLTREQDNYGLWLVNADGSSLARLAELRATPDKPIATVRALSWGWSQSPMYPN